ncbi:MAG: hypothetical protein ACR2JB_23635 [Bryobacteraceae bacterium]
MSSYFAPVFAGWCVHRANSFYRKPQEIKRPLTKVLNIRVLALCNLVSEESDLITAVIGILRGFHSSPPLRRVGRAIARFQERDNRFAGVEDMPPYANPFRALPQHPVAR